MITIKQLSDLIPIISQDIHAQKEYQIDNITEGELGAIITHKIQCPETQTPFLDGQINQAIYEHLSKKAKTSFLVGENQAIYNLTQKELFNDIPYPPPEKYDFTFIDLFAGIGGFRLAFQNAGNKCIFTSEWDKYAKQTYLANFGEIPYGDITLIDKTQIPKHDILCAGFPCQPFSLAGVSKKQSLGRKHGFEDETQGTLFFQIKKILEEKRPKAFMLENVKNLLSHDKGKTFETIRYALEDELQYVVNWKVVDGASWVPQHRERIYIVGYDPQQVNISKDNIQIPSHPSNGYKYPELNTIIEKNIADFTLGPGTWATLERHKANHKEKGNGFGYGLHKMPIQNGEVTRTISARYHKDGAEILIEQKGNRPRRLTVREAMQLQGYDPEKFIFPVSNTQSYKQIGNSVVVPAIQECAKEITKTLQRYSNAT